MPTIYLSLGSNLGDREQNLREAAARLQGPALHVLAVSPIYESEPVGTTPGEMPPYLNCVVMAETTLGAEELLGYTQAVEREGGRERSYLWAPRTIDIDILLYGSETRESGMLTIPHPRLKERAFALRPLADLAPDLVLPGGAVIRDLLETPEIAAQSLRPWANRHNSIRP